MYRLWPGTTNLAGGDNASGNNTRCEDTLCGVNERVQNNTCVACPAGTANAIGGDNASGPNTTCDDAGAANEYVNRTHACPAEPGIESSRR